MPEDLKSQSVLSSRELGVISLGAVNHIVGNAAALLTKPLGGVEKNTLVLDCEAGSFRVRLGDFTAVGADVVINGAFAADTDWTKGTGWTIAAGIASSDASQTADSDLEQTLADTTLVEGEWYDISFTVTGVTAGNITPVVGGNEGTDRATNATHTETIQAGASQVLALRADLAFDGDVDNFSIKLAAIQAGSPTASNLLGTGTLKLRADSPLAITAPSEVTVLGASASDILTYYWI